MTGPLHKTHRAHTMSRRILSEALAEYFVSRGEVIDPKGEIHLQVRLDNRHEIIDATVYLPRERKLARPTKKANKRKKAQALKGQRL